MRNPYDLPTIRRAAIGTALALLAGVAGSAPVQTPPAAQPFRLGSLRLVALRDAINSLPNDGKVIGNGVGPAAVADVLRAAGAPTDTLPLGVDALLVTMPGHVVLLDTGLGPKVNGALTASLAAVGVAPGSVTDVLITHSHADHVGGLVAADGTLAFPGATIRMSAPEWAWMQAHDAPALVAAIAPKVQTFEPGAQVLPGITAVALPGHTPGHSGYEIVSGNRRLLDMGDTAHSAIVSLARPGWTIGYDGDAQTGVATREAELGKLAASGELVFAPHFPFPGVGRIVRCGQGFAWQPGLR